MHLLSLCCQRLPPLSWPRLQRRCSQACALASVALVMFKLADLGSSSCCSQSLPAGLQAPELKYTRPCSLSSSRKLALPLCPPRAAPLRLTSRIHPFCSRARQLRLESDRGTAGR